MAKRICVFLLLGVLLFSIALSGCSQKEETEASDNETGCKNVAFHELIDLESIEKITVSCPIWAANREILSDDAITLFLEQYFKDTHFSDDETEVSLVSSNFNGISYRALSISFQCMNGSSVTVHVDEQGNAVLLRNGKQYVLVHTEKLDYEAIKNT